MGTGITVGLGRTGLLPLLPCCRASKLAMKGEATRIVRRRPLFSFVFPQSSTTELEIVRHLLRQHQNAHDHMTSHLLVPRRTFHEYGMRHIHGYGHVPNVMTISRRQVQSLNRKREARMSKFAITSAQMHIFQQATLPRRRHQLPPRRVRGVISRRGPAGEYDI